MEDLVRLLPKNLYHSYIIETNDDALSKGLLALLEERNEIEERSSDVLSQVYDAFTVSNTAMIKEWHTNKNVTSGKKVCIISTKFINYEAQASLLKILEEPQEGTHFFLLVPDASLLIETIRSRAHTIKISSVSSTKRAEEFMKQSVKERLEKVAELIEIHKDAIGSGALRHEAISFLNELEKNRAIRFKKERDNKEILFALREIEKGRSYLSTPGASVKMILEHIALIV